MKRKLFSIVGLLSLLAASLFVFPAGAETINYCGTPTVVTLYAGQTINSGSVTVGNDENYLYVTFSASDPWLLSETHLHVADSLASIPQNKKGNPKVGNFAYQRSYDPLVAEDTYVIAKSDLGLDANNSVVIAAHAVVVQVDGAGNVIANETGWGYGERFVDKGSWATYFQYEWEECDAPPPPQESGTETAFAVGDLATCFLDLDMDMDAERDFNRWGWTNGALAEGSYSFDIYAGAGQCDLTKGTFVGTLSVNYSNGTATVTFQMTETDATTGLAYNLVETHLYVGSEILAKDVNGAYTVAPGQYPTIHDELANVLSDSYTISGLSGDIYVVAHATVAGFPVE